MTGESGTSGASRAVRDWLALPSAQQRFGFQKPAKVAAEIIAADVIVPKSFERHGDFEPFARIAFMTEGPTHCFVVDRRSALKAYVGLGLALGYLRWPGSR